MEFVYAVVDRITLTDKFDFDPLRTIIPAGIRSIFWLIWTSVKGPKSLASKELSSSAGRLTLSDILDHSAEPQL